jgi:two-component sensor histidine kinase
MPVASSPVPFSIHPGVVGSPAGETRADARGATVLLHEVEHRVKNNLQLISSLIQFQSRRTADPAVRDALREVLDRVSAVSIVHRRMFQAEDPGRFELGEFLRDIVDDQLGRSRRADVEVRFDLEPATAPAASAAPLALLVNEILGRALSVGLPPPGGRLEVELRSLGDRVRLKLSHNGPSTAEDLRDSLDGPSSIVDILRRQLRAEIEWRDNQPGAAALITVPMERGA